jgi:hypothetical protein
VVVVVKPEEGRSRGRFRMEARVAFGVVCLLFLGAGWGESGWASDLVVTGDTLSWHSPNFTSVPLEADRNPPDARATDGRIEPPGELAYDRYFESHGSPPPLDFLTPLAAPPADLAQLERGAVVFPKTGGRVTLGKVLMPPGSSPASPYLLSGTGRDWVLVVHPYYLVQGKETHHVVEVYSADGVRRGSFDSLPTHSSARDPQLLIAPERVGCCDTLRWSIRFYDLRQLSVSEYGCPENRCGDVVFTKLGSHSSFLIALETVARVRDTGSVTETSIHIVSEAGTLMASGRLIYAVRDSPDGLRSPGLECALPAAISAQSPYAVRYLVSVDSVPGGDGWVLRFNGERGMAAWKLVSVWDAPSPSVAFAPTNAAVEQ